MMLSPGKVGRLGGSGRRASAVEAALFGGISLIGAGMTYSRADATTCATRVDSSGNLQLVAANSTPYDYTWGDQAYLSEEARQNKCTNYNLNPTDLTGLTKSGDAASVLAIVSDTSALTAAKIHTVCTNGNAIELDNSLGVATATCTFSGTTGNTNPHSFSVYAYVVSGSFGTIQLTGSTPGTISFNNTEYQRIASEYVIPSGTTVQFKINAAAGTVIRFVLNQLEEGRDYTSVIKVDGAARTRAKTFFQRTDAASQPWMNAISGGMVFEITPTIDAAHAAFQGIAYLGSASGFPTDGYYLQVNATSSKVQANGKGNNVAYSAVMNTGLWKRKRIPVGMTWQSGADVIGVIGPASNKKVTMTNGINAAITTLTIGSFPSNLAQFNGWIHSAGFFNRRPSVADAARYMLGDNVGYTERGVILAGQSNAENLGNGTTTNFDNAGEKAFRTTADSILGTSSRNWLINGATGSTSITNWEPGGAALAKFELTANAYLAAGGIVDAIAWDQGEGDVGLSTSTLKTRWAAVFNYLIAFVAARQASPPDLFIVPLGKYHYPVSYNDSTNNGAIAMRQAQRELASENANFHITMEKSHQALVDAIVHLTDAAYAAHAINLCRFIYKTLGETVTGGIIGPSITGAARTGASIAVTTAQDGGTDFPNHSPTVDGWRFFQNGSSATPIDVDSVTYNSATSLTVALASDPGAGPHTLMYANDLLYDDVPANLILDNNVVPLALRQFIDTAVA